MAKKEAKTNAMRILDSNKIPYTMQTYECDEFIDGIHVADLLGYSHEKVFKTITTIGKTKNYYVFVLPIEDEIDFKKAAKIVGEKSLEMLPLKDLTKVTGYIRGGCTSVGLKKPYPVVIHESAKELGEMAVSGGRRGLQLTLKPEDLQKVTKGIFGDIVKDH